MTDQGIEEDFSIYQTPLTSDTPATDTPQPEHKWG